MTFFGTAIFLHLFLGACGGFSLKCAMGFCKHPEHAWRRHLTVPLFMFFCYLEAVLTVSLIG